LCSACNYALGYIRENIKSAKNMVNYLIEHNITPIEIKQLPLNIDVEAVSQN